MALTISLAVIFVGVAVALLSIGIIVKKNGKFPDTHIEDNKALKEKGIGCAHTQLEGEVEKKRLRDLTQ